MDNEEINKPKLNRLIINNRVLETRMMKMRHGDDMGHYVSVTSEMILAVFSCENALIQF